MTERKQRDDYINALYKAHEDGISFNMVKSLIDKHFKMIEHMKKTSLYYVYEYEEKTAKAVLEPLQILAFENENLKKEVNKLRRELGRIEKYKERRYE